MIPVPIMITVPDPGPDVTPVGLLVGALVVVALVGLLVGAIVVVALVGLLFGALGVGALVIFFELFFELYGAISSS